MSKHERFSELLGLSINRAIEIMNIPLSPKMPDFARIMSTQQAIAASVFATAARIDEAQLRRVQVDKLDELLDLIRQAEAEDAQVLHATYPARLSS